MGPPNLRGANSERAEEFCRGEPWRQGQAWLRVAACTEDPHTEGGAESTDIAPDRSFAVARIAAAAGSDFSPVRPAYGHSGNADRTGWNGETWGADQRISVDQALPANTIDGAYASHEEAIKGSITAGKPGGLRRPRKTILTGWTRTGSRTLRSCGP
jgi:hypothetical protein